MRRDSGGTFTHRNSRGIQSSTHIKSYHSHTTSVPWGNSGFFIAGSESPAPFEQGNKGRQQHAEGERLRQMAKTLIGPEIAEKQLSNEISAPYEVPQYPIEQIETKLIR